jgi:hypothetical protein
MKAAQGDVRAAQEIADRTEGRLGMATRPREFSPSDLLGLTIPQWDKIMRGESLIDETALESAAGN